MIYLASPYSHPEEAIRYGRFHRVCEVCAKLMMRGLHIYSPIAHTHPVAVCGEAVRAKMPTDFKVWREYDTWFISRVDAVYVLMLDGWKESVGVTAEIEMAREYNIPVKYLTAEGDDAGIS